MGVGLAGRGNALMYGLCVRCDNRRGGRPCSEQQEWAAAAAAAAAHKQGPEQWPAQITAQVFPGLFMPCVTGRGGDRAKEGVMTVLWLCAVCSPVVVIAVFFLGGGCVCVRLLLLIVVVTLFALIVLMVLVLVVSMVVRMVVVIMIVVVWEV